MCLGCATGHMAKYEMKRHPLKPYANNRILALLSHYNVKISLFLHYATQNPQPTCLNQGVMVLKIHMSAFPTIVCVAVNKLLFPHRKKYCHQKHRSGGGNWVLSHPWDGDHGLWGEEALGDRMMNVFMSLFATICSDCSKPKLIWVAPPKDFT